MRHLILALASLELLLIVGCTSSKSSSRNEEGVAAPSCNEPDNPYDEGTGHYAGYAWAEEDGSGVCSGSSESFTEGCEEYERQEAEYQECEAQKKR
jgi:hypothetical protein